MSLDYILEENYDVERQYINEEFIPIPKSDGPIHIYISNESQNELLAFQVEVTEFEENEITEFKNMLKKLRSQRHPHMLPIRSLTHKKTKDDKMFTTIYCDIPYLHTYDSYNQQNELMELEFKSHIYDVIQIYQFVQQFGYEVQLSFSNASIVTKRCDLPFPRLCITPYAYIKAFFDKIEGENVSVYQPFAGVFEFFNQKIADLNSRKQMFGWLWKVVNMQEK